MGKAYGLRAVGLALLSMGALVALACGDDALEGAVGSACQVAGDCYVGVEGVAGTVECLDRTADGYCTHACTKDEDCCAAEGECPSGKRQVCAPFESTGRNLCFLSCEASDLGAQDGDAFCQEFADREFGCRSTGGGNANRKVCFPN